MERALLKRRGEREGGVRNGDASEVRDVRDASDASDCPCNAIPFTMAVNAIDANVAVNAIDDDMATARWRHYNG